MVTAAEKCRKIRSKKELSQNPVFYETENTAEQGRFGKKYGTLIQDDLSIQ